MRKRTIQGLSGHPRTWRDVMDRPLRGDTARTSEERLHAFFDRVPVGLYRTTPDGRIVAANAALVALLKYPSRDAFLAARADSLYLDPADRHHWLDALRQEGVVHGFQMELRCADGSTVWVEDACRAVVDADGEVLYEGCLVDITRRKRAERSLIALAAALEASSDGISIADANGEFVFANRAMATLYRLADPAELLGRSWRLLYGDDELARFDEEILPAFARAGHWAGEAIGRRKDGTTFPQEISMTALPGGGLVCIDRDITERQQLEQQFRQSQKMEAVGRLAGGVAHDFNNLLTVILGNSQLLLAEIPSGANSRELVEEIRDAAGRAGTFTRQLLAFSRRQVLVPQVLDLNALVRESEQLLRRLIGEDIELIADLTPDLQPVKADPGQLQQVIMNLALNARDAMPDGGELRLATRTVPSDDDRGEVLLSISDTGTGMDAEVLRHVFEPFFSTKEPGKGTGLGLATVYGIVEQSGGRITVRSKPGQGTTFSVYLPEASGTLAQRRTSGETVAGGNETILLVEDDAGVRSLTRRVLAAHGYHVLEAESPKAALAEVESYEGPIHLLLTDIVMPKMSGRELAEQLARARPDLRVLFMSGYTDDAVVRKGLELSAIAYLEKPYTPETLLRRVRRTLRQE